MMPAGKYYIGDLCYVMTDKEWDQFCRITIEGHMCLQGEFEMPDGRRFATYTTMYGDGLYKDQFGHKYSVDAGLIGCIRVEDIHADKYDDLERLGAIVEFKRDFFTSRTDAGVIQIDNVVIDTNPEYDYEEDEE